VDEEGSIGAEDWVSCCEGNGSPKGRKGGDWVCRRGREEEGAGGAKAGLMGHRGGRGGGEGAEGELWRYGGGGRGGVEDEWVDKKGGGKVEYEGRGWGGWGGGGGGARGRWRVECGGTV